jgi:hypothetical protein
MSFELGELITERQLQRHLLVCYNRVLKLTLLFLYQICFTIAERLNAGQLTTLTETTFYFVIYNGNE